MSNSSEDLESILEKSFLNLEKIDTNIFRSCNLWHLPKTFAVYGGQLVGQALAASSKTVPHTHEAHSVHCYYINKGRSDEPILYYVERTRDGNTYCSRNVTAVQDDQTLLTMQTSLKSKETDEFHHQFSMPVIDTEPEQLLSVKEICLQAIKKNLGTERQRMLLLSLSSQNFPFKIKPLFQDYFFEESTGTDTNRKYWIKACGYIGEDFRIHQCAAAYLTDYLFMDVAVLNNKDTNLQLTSLDHSIWFHNSFQANEWLLYEMEIPQRGDGTALVMGRLWRQDGVLAMSVAQEGIMRPYAKL